MPKDDFDFFSNDTPRRGAQDGPVSFDALKEQIDQGAAPAPQEFSGYMPLSLDFDDAPPASPRQAAKPAPFLFEESGGDAEPFDFDFGDVPIETPLPTQQPAPTAPPPARPAPQAAPPRPTMQQPAPQAAPSRPAAWQAAPERPAPSAALWQGEDEDEALEIPPIAPRPQSAPEAEEINFDDLKPREEKTARKKPGELRLDDLPPRPPKPARKGMPPEWDELAAAKPAARTKAPVVEGLEPLPPKSAQTLPPLDLEGIVPPAAKPVVGREVPPAFPEALPRAQAAPQAAARAVPETARPQAGGAARQTAPVQPAAQARNTAPQAPAQPAAQARNAAPVKSAPRPVEDDGTIVAAGPASAPPPAAPRPAPAAARGTAQAPKEAPQRPRRPGVRPVSKIADSPTLSFSLGNNVNVEAPTLAFMPISDITAAARAEAEANAKDNVFVPQQPPQSPQVRAARIEKEKNVGAAVFSALMDAPEPSVTGTDSADREGSSMQDPNWPAPPRAQNGQRGTPKPIDWNASLLQTPSAAAPAQQQAQQPRQQPQTPPSASPRPAAARPQSAPAQPDSGAADPLDFGAAGAQPLAFDLDEGEPLGDDLLESYSRQFERADDDDGDDEDESPRRRGPGGARPSKGGAGGSTTWLWWIGFLVIALLIILYFVIFADKGDPANSGSGTSGGSSGTSSSTVSGSEPGSQTPDDSSSDVPVDPVTEPIPRDEWYMVLANRDNRLPSTFAVPQTVTVGSAAVDSRIADALRQMVNDASAAGIQLLPNNGYRTVGEQQAAWDRRVKEFLNQGLSQQEAEERALDYTSMAGASDHNTGLGLDIVSQDHQTKDLAYAETAASQWLVEHAAEYGFIQRYPADKELETGMDYEPWHYRYVGPDQAAKIKASGLCLEEYLAQP